MNPKLKFLATAIGSLPLNDPAKAVEVVLASIPEAPIWPQLPRLGIQEQMEIQYSEGIPCAVVDRAKGLDTLEVQVEVTAEFFADTVGALEELQTRISRSIEGVTGLRAEVRLVAPRTLQRSEGKAKRVIDKRNL